MIDNVTKKISALEESAIMPSISEVKWHELITVLSLLISNYTDKKLKEGEKHNEQV